MAFKDWFRDARSRAEGREPRQLSVEDLIALGRLEEARGILQARLKKSPRNHHTRLKLADLLMKLGRSSDAVDQYLEVAEGYSEEGFYDKAHALLAKLSRMLPHEAKLVTKMERLEHAKEMERRRGLVQEAIREGGRIRTSSFAVQHLWTDLVKCPLVALLSDAQLGRLFRALEIERLEEGDFLVESGEEREELFIVVQGEIAAEVLLATGKRTDLQTFSAGDMIGEHALLARRSWPATYRAKRRTSLLSLDRDGLESLLVGEDNPRSLLDALRCQKSDQRISEACAKLGGGPEA